MKEYYQKKVKHTAIALMAVGAIGILVGTYHVIQARHIAERIFDRGHHQKNVLSNSEFGLYECI
jgi:uncharacterized membrane protein